MERPESSSEGATSGATSVASFDAFYSTWFAPLYRSMLLIGGDASEAEDVTHEAFVRVLERWESVSRMEAPRAYLFTTALNLERNRLRRLRRRSRQAPADRNVEDDFTEQAARRAQVLGALRRLSREHREAIVLVDFLEMTSREAGRIASVSADALRARLHRARAAMREELMTDD